MRKVLLALLFSLIFIGSSYATHQRAAEITYRHLDGLSYEFTITMYTRTSSPADNQRNTMPIFWGDETGSEIPRIDFVPIPGVADITYNRYVGQHTFPAPGRYLISVEDPNRNGGVVNIPNSINVPMYIETELVINPFLGSNNSVQLLNPPIDKGCVGQTFIHNPAAYDPDGDSLSYRLVVCKGAGGYDTGHTLDALQRADIRNSRTLQDRLVLYLRRSSRTADAATTGLGRCSDQNWFPRPHILHPGTYRNQPQAISYAEVPHHGRSGRGGSGPAGGVQ